MQKADLLHFFCEHRAGIVVALPTGPSPTASVPRKGRNWYCQFCHQNDRQTTSIGKVSEDEARAESAQVEYLLMRLKCYGRFLRLAARPPCALSFLTLVDGLLSWVENGGGKWTSPGGRIVPSRAEGVPDE